jgi:hypothetical protein
VSRSPSPRPARARTVPANQSGTAAPPHRRENGPSRFRDLADKFEQRIVEQWQDCIREVVAVDGIDFRSNLQRQTDFARDGDCLVETFLGRYPAEKSEIPARPVAEAMQIARQPVLHRAVPVGPAERRPL